MPLGSNPAQHQELWGVDGSGRQDDLLLGMDDPHLAIPLELDSIGDSGVRIYQDLGDVGVHGDVEVLPVPDWTEEGFGGGAAGSLANRALRDHESGLEEKV